MQNNKLNTVLLVILVVLVAVGVWLLADQKFGSKTESADEMVNTSQSSKSTDEHIYTDSKGGFSIGYNNINAPSSNSYLKTGVLSVEFMKDQTSDDSILVFDSNSKMETVTGYGPMTDVGTSTFGNVVYEKYVPANNPATETAVHYVKTGIQGNRTLFITIQNPKEHGVPTYLDLASLIINGTATASNSTAWVKSPVYGIYYPAGYEINEYGYLNASQKGQGLPESSGIPTFSATNGTIILSWGGAQSGCTDTDYGVFKYGATVTCLKGMTAQLGSTNPRNPPISQAEVNIFGDFVTKNK